MSLGGEIVSKVYSAKGRENHERIFGKKPEKKISKKKLSFTAINRAVLTNAERGHE